MGWGIPDSAFPSFQVLGLWLRPVNRKPVVLLFFFFNYYLHLFFVAFIPQAISFWPFFSSVSPQIFFSFCAASSFVLGTICSFSVRIFSVWQGELVYGLIRP